ncbi:MAG: hypothetical protein IPK82_08810 [Polyangiaceae bacterium]|nr:hypothetical protein [Polyangiaceae bacterium]
MPILARPLRWIAVFLPIVAALPIQGCDGESTGVGGGGTTSSTPIELPPPLDPLPAVEPTKTDQFATGGTCAQCHFAGESATMHDPNGEDISPVHLWRASMMAFATKDPYYLSVVQDARTSRPEAEALIDAACLRCHAPAASIESMSNGATLTFESITEGSDPVSHLARDGVTCSLCHQISPDNLGESGSFSGGFEVGFDREMFGPHKAPNTQPMEFFVEYTPVYAEHITKSEVCATCHTVVVPFLDASGNPTGDGFLEQATYLEWQNSTYASNAPCGQCHLPTEGSDGLPISSAISKYPDNLSKRTPFGQHSFEGGNAYMLRILADNVAWTGSEVSSAELLKAAERGEAHLQTAAELTILEPTLSGSVLMVGIDIVNRTGHKLPTGYPSRRMWLHVVGESQNGEILFESGKPGSDGSIESNGKRVDLEGLILPHRDEVGEGEVQVYEAIAVDSTGEPNHRPLQQIGFGKDNRILPEGWSNSGPNAEWTAPQGIGSDATFAPGKDRVTYRMPAGSSITRVKATLYYQTLPRTNADALAVTPVPAAVRFSDMVKARPPAPVVMATAVRE